MSVNANGAFAVTIGQSAIVFAIAERHNVALRAWMVEAEYVSQLMGENGFQIEPVLARVWTRVESNFPEFLGIEADHRSYDRSRAAGRLIRGQQVKICEGYAVSR